MTRPCHEPRITAPDGRYQRWWALGTNRRARRRAGEFLVQGVRPITQAVAQGWAVDALLYADGRRLSRWASELLEHTPARVVTAVDPELLGELGDKDGTAPELLAVVRMAPDRLDRLPRSRDDVLVVAFDRPASPGNLGSVIRSADALGAHGVIVCGHAVDLYDPRTVRASTGSLFALPVVRAESHRDVLAWAGSASPRPLLVGTSERASTSLWEHDFRGPTVVVAGNEGRGMSAGWRDACDVIVGVPMSGSASSLNAAAAVSTVLYEAVRQRSGHPPS